MRPLVEIFSEYLRYQGMATSKADVKTVTLPETEELLQRIFDDGTRKPVTIKQYISHVIRLYRGLFGSEAEISGFDWLQDADRVITYFAETYSDKLSMQATGLNPLLVITKKEFSKDQELYQTYYKRYQTVRDLMEKAKPPPQQLSESEYRNWKTLDQINELRVELQRKVNRNILPKSPDQLSVGDRVILMRYLVLSLYTNSPSLRNDFSNLPIIRFEDLHGQSARILMAGSGNYLLEYAKDQYKVVLKDFKTVRTHGEQKIDLPQRSCNIVSDSLRAFPRRFLLSRMRNGDEPMTRNYLTIFCSKIFPDANVGTCLLRKICVSNQMKDAPSIAERQALAKQMLHSPAMQMRIYEKHYLPNGQKIQFSVLKSQCT
jgi:hypothetical protein